MPPGWSQVTSDSNGMTTPDGEHQAAARAGTDQPHRHQPAGQRRLAASVETRTAVAKARNMSWWVRMPARKYPQCRESVLCAGLSPRRMSCPGGTAAPWPPGSIPGPMMSRLRRLRRVPERPRATAKQDSSCQQGRDHSDLRWPGEADDTGTRPVHGQDGQPRQHDQVAHYDPPGDQREGTNW
jgi:hypothetical protein